VTDFTDRGIQKPDFWIPESQNITLISPLLFQLKISPKRIPTKVNLKIQIESNDEPAELPSSLYLPPSSLFYPSSKLALAVGRAAIA
jgi:hypothetical protein